MNLFSLLADRAEAGQPVRVGLIGAGKFGTMFLAQARRTAGIHIAGIADLSIDRTVGSLQRAGWPAPQYGAESIDAAYRDGSTWLVEDAERLISADGVELVIEATGDPIAGVKHALMCIGHGRHVVMVNVEADALVGPALVQRADDAGVVYSLAYGDQPALICEMVDWAAPRGSMSSRPAKEPNIYPRIMIRPRTPFGNITGLRRRKSSPVTSTRVCSTRSSMEPNPRSRWRRLRMQQGLRRQSTVSASRRQVSMIWRTFAALNRTAECWMPKGASK